MKDKKLKEVHESQLLIRKVVERGVDANGRKFIRSEWFVAEDPVNFGSLGEKQNEDILEYKYRVLGGDNIFSKLFK